MKTKNSLPPISLAYPPAKWEEREQGRFQVKPALCCGPFEVNMLYLDKGASYNLCLQHLEALTVLEGNINFKADSKDNSPWINISSYWFSADYARHSPHMMLFTALANSLILRVRYSDLAAPMGPPEDRANLTDLSSPFLILHDRLRDDGCLPLRWSEFRPEDTPGLFRTQPDVVVGDYHLKLWRALPNMNCGIHRHSQEPGLEETHCLLEGSGEMVVYERDDPASEVRRLRVEDFGKFHEPLFTREEGNIVHPWHAWQAGPKGSLFLALEKRPSPEKE